MKLAIILTGSRVRVVVNSCPWCGYVARTAWMLDLLGISSSFNVLLPGLEILQTVPALIKMNHRLTMHNPMQITFPYNLEMILEFSKYDRRAAPKINTDLVSMPTAQGPKLAYPFIVVMNLLELQCEANR
jgi:hypothetical protein